MNEDADESMEVDSEPCIDSPVVGKTPEMSPLSSTLSRVVSSLSAAAVLVNDAAASAQTVVGVSMITPCTTSSTTLHPIVYSSQNIPLLQQRQQQSTVASSIELAISKNMNKDSKNISAAKTLSEFSSKILPPPAVSAADVTSAKEARFYRDLTSQPSYSLTMSSSLVVTTSFPETSTTTLTYVTTSSSSKTVLSSSLIQRAESIDSGDSTDSDNDDESSELDEEECERRKDECLKDMTELEIQFSDMKEQLYSERTKQIQSKLEETRQETAQEYLKPLSDLRRNMEIRLEVADVLRDFKREAIKNRYDCEMQMANQSYDNEKFLQMELMREDLGEKIKRLEEDRNSIDVYTDLWNDAHSAKKQRKRCGDYYPDKKRKPVTVSGPYIVYMLRDFEILEDWTTIRKARNATMRKKFER